ncbi:hypothetical protein I7X09_07720 [Rhodococcus sp. P-2]|nr:hypothetical protein I7X09_07720 [Rhodococcus sp. P-2]
MPHSLTWEYVDPGKTDESSRFVITRVTTGSPVHSGTTVDRVSTTPGTTSQARIDDPRVKSGAPLAAVIGLLGAVGVAASPVVGVGSGRGVDTMGAVTSAALFAAVCTIVAPLVALLVSGRRPAMAGGLLAGIGAVSLGAAILDVQLFVDAIDANRLDLFRPISAGSIDAGPGAYLALAGHGLLVVAGVLGLMVVHRESERDGYGSARAAEFDGRSVGGRIGGWPTALLILAAVVFVLSLFGPSFSSQDPIFLVKPLVDSASATAVGTGLVGVAVLVAVAAALTSISLPVGCGALIGVGLGALAVSGTRVMAGFAAGDRIGVGSGSVVGALAAVVIVVIGVSAPYLASRRETGAIPAESVVRAPTKTTKGALKAAMVAQSRAAQARVDRLHRVAGAAAIITAAVAGVGSALPVLSLPEGIPEPSMLSSRLVLLAAAVLLLAALGLFAPGRAAVVRPAVGVLWTTVVMGVAAVMQSAVIATDVPGVGLGIGAFVLCGTAFLAAATGLLVWLAGSAEREDVDTSVDGGSRGLVLLVGGIGAVAVLIGTALPLYQGDTYTAASVLEWPWGIDVWGQLLVGVTVVIAAVIAASARPSRGAALLIGSAVAALVYVSEWPLTSSRISDATVGVGAITAATGIVLLLVAAFSSARISETDA